MNMEPFDPSQNMEMASAGGAVFGVIFIIFILIGIVSFGLWIWSLIHCASNKELDDTNRIIGIILIVLLGLLGSLIYLFLPRTPSNQRNPRNRRNEY